MTDGQTIFDLTNVFASNSNIFAAYQKSFFGIAFMEWLFWKILGWVRLSA